MIKMYLKLFFSFMICIIFFVFAVLIFSNVKEEMMSEEGKVVITEEMRETCLVCHMKKYTESVFHDWKQSKHSKQGIGCELCHITKDDNLKEEIERVRLQRGIKKSLCQDERVNNLVPPKVCAQCHPEQFEEFSVSNHGNAFKNLKVHLEMNNEGTLFDKRDCLRCHQVEFKCSSCHSRHKFSLEFARKPETCGICHSGERHPQKERYFATMHGLTYQAEGNQWDWSGSIDEWHKKQAKRPHAVPLCITCHMVDGKHDNQKPGKIENFQWLCSKCHVSNNAVNLAMIEHKSHGAEKHAIEVAQASNNLQCKICHHTKKGDKPDK